MDEFLGTLSADAAAEYRRILGKDF
jgi:hypothetical protein